MSLTAVPWPPLLSLGSARADSALHVSRRRGFRVLGLGPNLWPSSVSLHTAELLSLVVALRFRKLGEWHFLAFVRMHCSMCSKPSHLIAGPVSLSLPPVGVSPPPSPCRSDALLAPGSASLAASPPAWRLHQLRAPAQYNVTLPVAGKPCQFSRIAFVQVGLAGSTSVATPVCVPLCPAHTTQ